MAGGEESAWLSAEGAAMKAGGGGEDGWRESYLLGM